MFQSPSKTLCEHVRARTHTQTITHTHARTRKPVRFAAIGRVYTSKAETFTLTRPLKPLIERAINTHPLARRQSRAHRVSERHSKMPWGSDRHSHSNMFLGEQRSFTMSPTFFSYIMTLRCYGSHFHHQFLSADNFSVRASLSLGGACGILTIAIDIFGYTEMFYS